MITADVLFKGTVGGTKAPGASGFDDLRSSVMDKLMKLPPPTRVHPGHREPTTIGDEWESNPFIRVWRGLDPESAEEVQVWGQEATMKLWAPDYDGGNKAWVVFAESGEEAIVGGSQVERISRRRRSSQLDLIETEGDAANDAERGRAVRCVAGLLRGARRPRLPWRPPPRDLSAKSSRVDVSSTRGSGAFGRWTVDRFGLPAYRYAIDEETDPRRRPAGAGRQHRRLAPARQRPHRRRRLQPRLRPALEPGPPLSVDQPLRAGEPATYAGGFGYLRLGAKTISTHV